MNRYHIRSGIKLILVSLFALFLITNTSHADSKGGEEKGKSGTIQSSEKSEPKPDLVIEFVKLDASCSIVLGVKNQGKGSINSKEFQRLMIQVKQAGQVRSFPVIKFDRNGKLAKPGGKALVETGLLVEKAGLVEARIDSTKAVIEQVETNNNERAQVKPTCKTKTHAATQGIEPLATGGSSAKKETYKKGLAQTGETSTTSATAKTDRSTIVVSALKSKNDTVIVVLKRQGLKPITPQDALRIRLQVEIGTIKRMFPLSQIDPMLRALNSKTGMVSFDTRIQLTEPTKIRASLQGSLLKNEITKVLRPEQLTAIASHKKPDSKKQMKGEKGQKKPRVKQKGKAQPKGDDNYNPNSFSAGMSFIRPLPNSEKQAGGEIDVQFMYQDPSNVQPYKLILLKGGTRIHSFTAAAFPPPRLDNKLLLALPDNLPTDDRYQIEVTSANGMFQARSQPFSIRDEAQAISGDIRVSIEGNPGSADPGETLRITLNGPPQPEGNRGIFQAWAEDYNGPRDERSSPFLLTNYPVETLNYAPEGGYVIEKNLIRTENNYNTIVFDLTIPTFGIVGDGWRFTFFNLSDGLRGASRTFSITGDGSLELLIVPEMVGVEPEGAVNMALTDIRVNQDGQLQAYVVTTPPADLRTQPSYQGRFVVKHMEMEFSGLSESATLGTVDKSISVHPTATSQGWVSLGHIDSFTTPTMRNRGYMVAGGIQVEMSIIGAIEFPLTDNSHFTQVPIMPHHLIIKLTGPGYEESTNAIRYSGDTNDQVVQMDWVKIKVRNKGYRTAHGGMFVYQFQDYRPGELDGPGPGERVELGSQQLTVEPTPGEEENLFSIFNTPGIQYPEWYEGRILIQFNGDFLDAANLENGEIDVEFLYRR